jgi:hypothetical protein
MKLLSTTSSISSAPSEMQPAVALPTSQGVERFLSVGGALWIAHYALQLLMGFTEGKVSMQSRFSLLDGFCFASAIVCFCLGLGWLSTRCRPRTALSTIGLIFAVVAATSIVLGMANFMVNNQAPGLLGAVGVVGSCLSATFVALAARRTGALPPRLANFLLLIGLLTFPLIVAFTWPGQFVPAFLTDELPFALSGLAYIVFGRNVRSQLSQPQHI